MPNLTPYQTYTPMYYVYTHADPDTKEVVYVGVGTKDRAYTSRATQRGNPEHEQWLQDVETRGYIPHEYVNIICKSSNRDDCLLAEAELIDKLRPAYNRLSIKPATWAMTYTQEEIAMIKDLRSEGMSYSKIAEEMGRSTMGVWRVANDKTKGYLI